MSASLIQLFCLRDEGSFGRKPLSLRVLIRFANESWMMTTLKEEAPANSVPAAAVRQKGQVLFRIIGRKGHVGGFVSIRLNSRA